MSSQPCHNEKPTSHNVIDVGDRVGEAEVDVEVEGDVESCRWGDAARGSSLAAAS
jgi:hypothetical protein